MHSHKHCSLQYLRAVHSTLTCDICVIKSQLLAFMIKYNTEWNTIYYTCAIRFVHSKHIMHPKGKEFQLLKYDCKWIETGDFLQLHFRDHEQHCSAVSGEGHSHCWGGDNYKEKKFTWVQGKYFCFVIFPCSELYMSSTIQWDIFLSSNVYLDFIKPLQLLDFPRISTIVIIVVILKKLQRYSLKREWKR